MPPENVAAAEMNDLTEEESVEFGQVIGKLLGVTELEAGEASAEAIEMTLAAASHSVGLDYKVCARWWKICYPVKPLVC